MKSLAERENTSSIVFVHTGFRCDAEEDEEMQFASI